MNKEELDFILQEGEGHKIEFKENLSNIDKEMVAFANAEGGRIFVGISDDNKIKGIIDNKLKSQIHDIANNCDPSIEIKLSKFENVLIVKVFEGKNKPYKCKEGFYLRIGANSQKLKRDKIISLAVNEGRIRFDEIENEDFNLKKDFDNNKLKDYLEKAGISKTIPKEKTLKELGVMGKRANNACILFFSKNPQKFLDHSIFTCILFRDKDGSDIIDRQEIEGSLIEIVEGVMNFIQRNTRVAYKFDGKPRRENIYEYPIEAIREAVINSVLHRDYFEQGHNNILRIFPDNLSITNVWTMPSWFKPGKDTFRRNKLMADLFLRINWIEKIGSGFARMRRYCREANANIFRLDLDEKYFRIIFFKSKDYFRLANQKSNEASEKTSEKTSEKIIRLIKENPEISARDLGDKLNLSPRAVEMQISNLKEKRLLKRIGPAKGGYWQILR